MIIDPKQVLEKVNDEFYSRVEVLEILRDNLETVEEYYSKRVDSLYRNDKYVDLAIKYGYKNYRMCSVHDIYRLGLFKSLSYYLKKFINEGGLFLVILNEMNEKVISCVFRRLDRKEFFDFSVYSCPYGWDLIEEDFRFGKPLLISEGIYDCDSIRHIFKNSMSVLTSNITIMYAEILCSVTDWFIICFDNDDAGKSGIESAIKRFKSINPKIRVDVINMYGLDKDLGEMEEYRWKGNLEEYNLRKKYYETCLSSLIDNNGF